MLPMSMCVCVCYSECEHLRQIIKELSRPSGPAPPPPASLSSPRPVALPAPYYLTTLVFVPGS